ncbi:hypothetical protein FS837_007185 [Tulasnella sp. UAMH 9824]|nr:hypothetical protein FS837_007185 [Tulasnella sp. UAMH 9824]
MSNLPSAVSEDGESSAEPDVTPLTEELRALQVEDMDGIPSRMTGEPKMNKLLARDLLATLSRMRISTTETEFIGNGHQAAGTYANVAVATFVKADGTGARDEEWL